MDALDVLARWPVSAVSAAVVELPVGTAAPETATDGQTVCEVPAVVTATWGEVDRVYPWASITKICTALAVLVGVEEKTLALDMPAGPPGATVGHLMAHASGLPFLGREPLAPPGRRRIYSNSGFEILGELLEERSGLSFHQYLGEAVLGQLGMSGVTLSSQRFAAAGISGSVRDLAALAKELLAPTLISRATLDQAVRVAFPGLAGMLPGFGHQDPCDWGLGFEIRDAKHPHWTGSANSPRTFGHFGQAGGFLWVDPAAGIALAVLSDTPFGPWAATAWPRLADAVLGEAAARSAEAGAGGTFRDVRRNVADTIGNSYDGPSD
ncbi:MAG: serine hydrolase [Actinomycetota bacterium]|jgi:CubicO group peptidase (beta-lactamase class C family)|nr:serine hydrolase [Actinomycetota bacterium]